MTDLFDGPEVIEVDESGNIIEPSAKKGRGREAMDALVEADLLKRCREMEIEEYAIRAGGDYRQYKNGAVYWLPLTELLEFEEADADIDSDKQFWAWFWGLIESRYLETKQERQGTKNKSWKDWRPNLDWKPKKIGSWWSDWGYHASVSSDSELTKRLALALRAINTTVSVVNDTGHRFKVRLAADQAEAPTSYTNINDSVIVVSPQALLDTSIETDYGIEVTTGYSLHEASHAKYTGSVMDALTQPTTLRPRSIASLLLNILEDLRIESLTGERFPGFKDYFTTAGEYLWDVTKEHMPSTWGPELKDKVNGVIGMAKWPTEFEPIALADPGLAAEYPWWRAWAEAYKNGTKEPRIGVIEALTRLAEDDETKEQMEQLSKEEEQEEQNSGRSGPLTEDEFGQLLGDLKKMLDNGVDPCPSPSQAGSQAIELTPDQANELERLLGEEYQTHEAFYKMHDGEHDVQPKIESERPIESDLSRFQYKKPGPMAERLRSAFFFRKQQTSETERLLKTGFVDEEELWRVGLSDSRVFERQTQPEDTFTSVTMLVDASGSMVGSGLDKAQNLANVMMACLRTQRGVRARVRAHSTGYDTVGASCKIYRIWEPGDPDTRLGLVSTIDHGANFDGFAIDWCAKELDDTALPNETKLLIVLSDGLPAGNFDHKGRWVHYRGEPAMEHMREVSESWGRRGVHIVQIAIEGDDSRYSGGIRPEDQAKMFKHWIGYESDQKLLTDLTKVLSKTFGAIE